MMNFSGKNVLITGGSRGIGAATVRAFANAGARVAFNYNKNYRAAENLKKECEKNGAEIMFMECDVSVYTEVTHFVEKVIEKFERIDILVNNAGIWFKSTIDTYTVDQWRKMIQVNMDSVFYFCTLISRHMKENKIHGSIVNLASTSAQQGEKYYSHYAASKGGIISFTKSLSRELGPEGIRINCVAPGWIRTDMTQEILKNEEQEVLSRMALGFIPEPRHIADGILFLASDLAAAITGEVLNINAGSVLHG